MVPLALTALAAGTSAAALIVLRRVRSRKALALGARATPLPAGVQHLAAILTAHSDTCLHLPARAGAGRPRIGSSLR